MRIIIAGSRTFNDYNLLTKVMGDKLRVLHKEGHNIGKQELEIVSGTAQGADRLGEKFANTHSLKLSKFPADWNIGKQAGYIRNYNMAVYAKEDKDIGVLIAFWNQESKGTKHMIDLANKKGLKVFVVNFKEDEQCGSKSPLLGL